MKLPNVCLIAVFSLFSTFCIQAQSRPNVIVILTDDQGSVDLNCYGAKDLYTPHIDNLARTGVKFSQFYVAAPVCSPSRASMMTGLNPHAAGLPGNTSSQHGVAGMPTDRFTMAEMMKSGGYATGHVGKWHIGYTPETMPNGQGFDYSFGHMGGCIDNYSHFFYWHGPNRHDLWENGKEIWSDGSYFPDMMEEKAEAFIESHQDEPFFLFYAINMPHYPLQPTARWREHYKDLPMPRRDYAAFVSTIDERIGKLTSKLETLGLRENTIIIFQSDHGHSTEVRTFGGGGDAGPFRGAKFSLFEGGIRVPAIISWPGGIPQNENRNQMAFNVDWFPTVAEYCGIEHPDVEGKSLVDIIKDNGQSTAHEGFVWKNGVSWAVRSGDWKLIGYPKDTSEKGQLDPDDDLLFLVNLAEDSTEMTNLAASYPHKVEELKAQYLKWPYADEEDIPSGSSGLEHMAIGKNIKLTNQPSKKYGSGGAASLLDGKTGTRVFSDGFWLGFEGADLEAIVDLGDTELLNSIAVSCFQDASNWIFFPEYMEVSWSQDGKKYSKPVRKTFEALKDANKKTTSRFGIRQEDVYGRYVKVKVKNVEKVPEWFSKQKGKAWLFVDEIAID